MIEREVQVPKERKLVCRGDLQPAARRHAAGDRRDDPLLPAQLRRAVTESQLNEQEPYNTRLNPGLPPTPIGNPGLASIKAAAKPAKGDLFYFVVKPGTCGKHVFTGEPVGVRAGRGRLPAGPRGSRAARRPMLSVMELGMPRLAVLGHPVAHSRSPAMHNAALAELGLAGEWSYEAIESRPQDLRGARPRLAGRGFAGVNVTVPHKLAALALADVAPRGGTRDRRREHAQLRRRRDRAPRTPTRAGLLAAIDALRSRRSGARARRGRLGPCRHLGAVAAGRRRAGLESHRGRAEALAAEFGARALRSARPDWTSYDLLVNCHHGRPRAGGRAAAHRPQT